MMVTGLMRSTDTLMKRAGEEEAQPSPDKRLVLGGGHTKHGLRTVTQPLKKGASLWANRSIRTEDKGGESTILELKDPGPVLILLLLLIG